MEKQIFTNEIILSWLQYYSQNTPIDLEHVKIIDITRKNKNVIPTVEAHKTTLVFTNAGIDDIFYRLWNAGLGECEVWYNEGSDPSGEILHDQIKDMINRGINASAGMLIINPNARNSSRIGLSNEKLQRGSIHYVGSEIRSIILSKMMVDPQDDICVIGGESIAIEAALIASEGSVIAVEYSKADPLHWRTMYRTLTFTISGSSTMSTRIPWQNARSPHWYFWLRQQVRSRSLNASQN